ncbi:MAG: YjjG family noncanonical pyrimidine nucleotidase [Cyclobacteriaceae bacterium]
MKRYTHVFFDLDHTIWDYERNSVATLTDLYDRYKLNEQTDQTLQSFIKTFSIVNDELWHGFHLGTISKDEIRERRFHQVFNQMGMNNVEFIPEFSNAYIKECPTKGFVIPGAIELLDYLKGKYQLHIITNGFEDIQHIKMSTTGMDKYFDEIIISGLVGYRKPQRQIFNIALERTGGRRKSSIMIGDNLNSDVIGARNAEIDQVYFNPNALEHQERITYEIRELIELKGIL